MHTIEVMVYVLNPNEECYDQVMMDVDFDIDTYEIESCWIDSKQVDLDDFKDDNPSLNKRIQWAIDDYVMNHEPNYMDCE
jgi:hypothetical protein